jgi:hypothetical protein
MKKMVLNYLCEGYESIAFTNKYIYGFYYKDCIVMVYSNEIIAALDKAAKNYGYSIRFKPNNKIKKALIENGFVVLCSRKYFDKLCKMSKYNKGEIFEKLVFEYFGLKWKKDNIPFYVNSDIFVNENHYQIKFEKATFTNETTLKNAITRKIARS